MFQFVVPISWSVFGRMTEGQQPFWGVGRLRLSSKGIREPQLGKCNDLRLFCILAKFGMNFSLNRADSRKIQKYSKGA
jgi:hypothetical protein